MATIVNTPPAQDNSANSTGFIVALLALLLVGYLFFAYGLPALRNATSSPQINVPDSVDVNINGGGGNAPQQPSQ